MRREIQGLRALAVMLVVIYHLWPQRLPGGYVGVDVFFVISGFLITAHLLRDVSATGKVSLPTFWARRARRLLPASLLVLGVVLVATLALAPETSWRQYISEISASAGYVQNWKLADNAVDYLAANNAASPVQHFWSLAVEEQFYLVWPIVILGAAVVARRRGSRARTIAVGMVMAAITTVSLAVSVVWTRREHATAYFATPTRMWEFGLGGLLALAPGWSATGAQRLRASASAAGLAVICWSAFAFDGALAFPGAVALVPVVATCVVIAAGDPDGPWSPTVPLRARPIQFLGDISYSLYLWHWPLIVFVPIVTEEPLSWPRKVVLLAAAILLAALTKRHVEDRLRQSRAAVPRRRRVFLAAALSSAAIVLAGAIATRVLDARIERDAARVLAKAASSCFGAAASDPRSGCSTPFAHTGAMTPAFAQADKFAVPDPAGGYQCETTPNESSIRRCVRGDVDDPERTIAMLGDSHSMNFLAPVESIAVRRHWKVVTYFKSACSGTGAADVVLLARPDDQGPCATWGDHALTEIARDPTIDTVVIANVRSAYMQDDGAAPIGPERYEAVFRRLTSAGKRVLVIADVPRTFGGDVPDCLATASDLATCDAPAGSALPDDAAAVAAARSTDDRVHLLDLTDSFCSDGVCHSEIGDVIVYSDAGHLTKTFATTLAPYIEVALLRDES